MSSSTDRRSMVLMNSTALTPMDAFAARIGSEASFVSRRTNTSLSSTSISP